MPNSFTQLYYHVVFNVKDHYNLLQEPKRAKIYAYLVGLCAKQKCFVMAINGGNDHVHMLIHAHSGIAMDDLMKFVKGNCSHWINQEQMFVGKFTWQVGYGAFTVSQSMLDTVKSYIEKQEDHHKRFSFRDEFKLLLEKHGIAYDERFLP
ncbi:MAG TPA: IS200/IS605 family transposase [Candidatus Cloacimonadota bacterium]|nr:IS200/IS605 family transposase [Candidatus Cloacimonadota bacterium]